MTQKEPYSAGMGLAEKYTQANTNTPRDSTERTKRKKHKKPLFRGYFGESFLAQQLKYCLFAVEGTKAYTKPIVTF